MSGDREELRRLVEELPDEQVPAALTDLRRRLAPVPEATTITWPPPWFGSIRAGSDFSRRYDEVLAEGFGRD